MSEVTFYVAVGIGFLVISVSPLGRWLRTPRCPNCNMYMKPSPATPGGYACKDAMCRATAVSNANQKDLGALPEAANNTLATEPNSDKVGYFQWPLPTRTLTMIWAGGWLLGIFGSWALSWMYGYGNNKIMTLKNYDLLERISWRLGTIALIWLAARAARRGLIQLVRDIALAKSGVAAPKSLIDSEAPREGQF